MNTKYENKKLAEGFQFIVGCDEVGRGSLAGPVVAAAVVFDRLKIKDKGLRIVDIKDSKLLTAGKREELADNIKTYSLSWSIGEVSSAVVDKINIHNATLLAMQKAVENLFAVMPGKYKQIKTGWENPSKTFIFIDGRFIIPGIKHKQQAIVGGDNKILSVAAASIVAKVYRDELMRNLDMQYPKYGFATHKGYGTLHHRKMIKKYGLSPIHRASFCKNLSV